MHLTIHKSFILWCLFLPELLIHLLIPTAALIIVGFNRKLVLLFCPLSILPDIDVFFGSHRGILHSLFILGSISIILIISTHYFKPQWKYPAIIISLLLLSHPLMDLFTGPTQLLWPIDSYYYLWIQAPTIVLSPFSIDFSSFFIKFLILTPQEAAAIGAGQPLYLFGNSGIISLILIGLAILYVIFKSESRNPQKPQLSDKSEGKNSL